MKYQEVVNALVLRLFRKQDSTAEIRLALANVLSRKFPT
jgi:hypothetical protein